LEATTKHLQEAIEAIAAIGTTTVVVLLFGIQTVLFFAIQAHPVFVIQALLLWAIQAAKVKVILVSPQVTPEIMGTPEVLFVCQVFSDNEIQWFAHEFAYHA
jgi:hypothetical protein